MARGRCFAAASRGARQRFKALLCSVAVSTALAGILLSWSALAPDIGSGVRSVAHAQVRIKSAVAVEAEEGADDANRPFTLPSQSAEMKEALDDCARQAKRAQWDRAFKSLQKVTEAGSPGLLPAKDGFWVPVRDRVRQLLTDLPADGKEAYRLLYDAEAKKLLGEATGKDELAKLNKLVSAYLFCSVGDVAADRLGDAYFEQGNMAQAAEVWHAALASHPESAIPRVRLLVKTAIALAHAGRWGEFHELQRQVKQRHVGESVVLGGRPVDAVAHLSSLAAASESAAGAPHGAGDHRPSVELPTKVEPVWQFRFLAGAGARALANLGQDWGWGRALVADMVPAAAADDKRVYVNLLGHHLAVDLATGKLLWRTAKFHDLADKAQQRQEWYTILPDQYGIALGEGRVWCVSRDLGGGGRPQPSFRLVCLDAATGKAVWSSGTIGELQSWNMCGVPLVRQGRVFVAGTKAQKATEAWVLALRASDGKLLWSTLVGTHKVDVNQAYNERLSQPSFLLEEDRLYVETHAGAVLELNAEAGGVNWGFLYETDVPDTNYWYGRPKTLTVAGPPIVSDGVLYFKGMRSTRLTAIRLSGPALLWQRPVARASMLAGVDGDRLFLAGQELTSLDLKTRQLQWSTPVPVGTSWIRPLMTQDRVYQFTPRGIFEVDKSSGDAVPSSPIRGADLDSLGGSILITPTAIITVSNLAVTAYPLERSTAAPAAEAGHTASAKKE